MDEKEKTDFLIRLAMACGEKVLPCHREIFRCPRGEAQESYRRYCQMAAKGVSPETFWSEVATNALKGDPGAYLHLHKVHCHWSEPRILIESWVATPKKDVYGTWKVAEYHLVEKREHAQAIADAHPDLHVVHVYAHKAVPDYTSDLEALRKVESCLDPAQQAHYNRLLGDTLSSYFASGAKKRSLTINKTLERRLRHDTTDTPVPPTEAPTSDATP